MPYKELNINVLFESFEKLVKNKHIVVTFNIKYKEYAKSPCYDDMREEMKENEMWSDLENLDHSGTFPPLRYRDDEKLIDEILNNIKNECWKMKQTEIRFLGKSKSKYYSGSGKKIKLVLEYRCN